MPNTDLHEGQENVVTEVGTDVGNGTGCTCREKPKGFLQLGHNSSGTLGFELTEAPLFEYTIDLAVPRGSLHFTLGS
jgi:hypothetical protein